MKLVLDDCQRQKFNACERSFELRLIGLSDQYHKHSEKYRPRDFDEKFAYAKTVCVDYA